MTTNPEWPKLSAWNTDNFPHADLAANFEKLDAHDMKPGRGAQSRKGFFIEEGDLNDLERFFDSLAVNKQRNIGERTAATNDAYEAAVILTRVRDGYAR